MKIVKVERTVEEFLLLATPAADQLFRKEFIDPKRPGCKEDPAEPAHTPAAPVSQPRVPGETT